MSVGWVAIADRSIAGWEAVIPAERLLPLASEWLRSGRFHEVFDVTLVSRGSCEPQPFDYLRHLEQGKGEPFALTPEEAPPGHRFISSGRICWLELDGSLAEGQVSDVGALLARLRPDDADWAQRFMGETAPVEILNDQGTLRIELRTDLWYPRVLALLDDAQVPPVGPTSDNTSPARCHTPRLNAFLREARGAVVALGGDWRLLPAEGLGRFYSNLTTEAGIELEVRD